MEISPFGIVPPVARHLGRNTRLISGGDDLNVSKNFSVASGGCENAKVIGGRSLRDALSAGLLRSGAMDRH
jgi:hypothetical protein